MVDLKYVSSSGVEFDLHDFDSAKLRKANFHIVKWNPETIAKQYGTTINRFTKDAQAFDCTFYFRGSHDERKTLIDNFIFQTEMDMATMKPGKIVWNEQYIQVYFISHNCHPVDDGENWTELTGQFYAAFPFWIKEEVFYIDPSDIGPGGLPEDVKGYPSDRDNSYAYTYSYPYGMNAGVYFVDSPIGADFHFEVYGPIDYFKVSVGGNNYQINYPLRLGQRLIVDSRDTLSLDDKCYVLHENGTKTNVFDYRDPTSSIFKRLPGGNVVIFLYKPYKIALTLFVERSAPI